MENLKNLSSEDRKRFAHIEGREDLFETKVLSFTEKPESSTEVKQSEVLVISRNPGSANALAPVLEILTKDINVKIDAIVDGRAQEVFQKKFQTTDVTPKDGALAIDTVVSSPDVLLTSPSETEQGLETYAASTFNEVPIVVVEDYYNSALLYLRSLKQRNKENIRLPEKICVMDEGAKKIILAEFPELADRIEVTGQPAFDRFAKEDTKAISEQTRKQLGIGGSDRLVAFMSSLEGVDFIKALAATLGLARGDFKLVFRRHPRDNTTYEEYEKIFKDAGVSLINTNQLDTDSVGAASDLVIVSTSTESLNAIYRRKPTLNIVDKKLDTYLPRKMPPTVELGVSVGVTDATSFSGLLPQLLDKESELYRKLQENMEHYYPQDGKNAERVAQVIQHVIGSKNH